LDKINIAINASPRSGNTFLLHCTQSAISKNYKLGNWEDEYRILEHHHIPMLLRLNNSNTFKQFTIARSPLQSVPSYIFYRIASQCNTISDFNNFMLNNNFILEQVFRSLEQQTLFFKEQFDNKFAILFKFEDLINDTHKVVEEVCNTVGMTYHHKIDINNIFHVINNMDNQMIYKIKSDDDVINNLCNHLPHNIKNIPEYQKILDMTTSHKLFDKCMYYYQLIG